MKGRQGGGYNVYTLFKSKWLKMDCHIIHLPKGSVVKEHVDPAKEGYAHHRYNYTLKKAKKGGETFVKFHDAFESKMPRSYHFRPDKMKHRVSKVEKGSVWIFSIGWLEENSKSN